MTEIPDPRAESVRHLERRRLLDLLRRVEPHGLAVVVAPPGYGKTTLLGQWSASHGGRVQWFHGHSLPDRADVVRAIELAPWTEGIVIDDLDHVGDATPAARDARFEDLVDAVAPHLPLVVATRRLPTVNLARHELPRSQLVTQRDLAFRAWEVAELFDVAYRDPLQLDEPMELAHRTEGWPAALRLWHLAGRRERRTDLQPSPRFRELIGAYLHRRILDGLSPHLLRLMRVSSVFDTMTAERLDFLLGTDTGHALLTEVHRRVDLVTSTGGGGLRLRYHRVLRDHLHAELVDDVGSGGARRLFDEAAAVVEQMGDVPEALAAHCRAGNRAEVGRLLSGGWSRLVASPGEWRRLVAGLQAGDLPVAARRRWASLLVDDGRRCEAATAGGAHDPSPDEEGRGRLLELVGRTPAAASAVDAPSSSAEALALLVRGSPGRARAALERSAAPTEQPARARLAVELALAVAAALVDPDDPAPRLHELYDDVDEAGLGWLRRLAFATALCRSGDPRGCDAALDVASGQRRRGDQWGAVLVEAAVAVATFRHGRPDVELMDRVAARFRALDAPVLEAWTRSASALAAAQTDLPDCGEAVSAESLARAVESPGALCLAYAALATRDPARGRELWQSTAAAARAAGLGCRPWTWLRDAGRADRPVPAGLDVSVPPRSSVPAPPARAAASPGHGDAAPWGGLTVSCLGEFRLRLHGTPVELSRVRPVALTVLRLLALHAGAPVHRDVIIAHQWSGLPEAAALHNLHVCVSNLRAGFEAAVPGLARTLLVRRGHAYLLAPGGEPLTDLQRVDAHLRNAAACRRAGDRLGEVEALRSAVELYAGEVLPGDGTAEWVVAARDREQLRAAGAAARLAVVELGRSRTEAAVSAAQRSVQIDPWRDASWQLLISVHERAGQPAAAERARKDYAAVLRSLGVTPMAVLPRAAPARRRSTREARRHGVGSAADVRTG